MSTGRPRFGLGLKFSLLLIAAIIGALLTLSYKFIGVSRSTTESLLKENHIGISDEISRRIQTSVDENLRTLRYVVEVFNDSRIPDATKVQIVESVLKNSKEIGFLAVYDERGKLIDVQKPRTAVLPVKLEDNLAVDSVWMNSGAANGVFHSTIDSLPYMRLVIPWNNKNGDSVSRLAGYLLTYISLGPLSDAVAEISHRRFGRSDLVYVVSDRGEIIAHADPRLVKERTNLLSTDLFTERDTSSIAEMFRRDVGFSKEYTNITKHEMLASFATLSRLRIGVLVEEPVDEAYASVNWMRMQLILWTGVGVLLSALIGIFFARTITRPMRKLVTATNEIAGGDYGNVLPITTHDEVAELTSSFNTMSLDLRKTFQALSEANDHIVKAEKMAMRGEIVSEVSHELKNFIQVVLIHTYSLRKMLPGSDPAKYNEHVAKIEAGLNQMHNFSENLLVRGGTGLNLQPVDVQEMITTFISFIKVLPKYGKGAIETRFTTEACGAMLDVDQLRQVLLNLVKNAVEARSDATLTFATERDEQRKLARILISDNGPGIPPQVREKLFKERITTKADGHGFGLPVCQKIIEAQGGTISVDSTLGVGTTFTLSFPLL